VTDIIRRISLQALKRFATGGDSVPDLLLEIENLRKLHRIREKELLEDVALLTEERDHLLTVKDESSFAMNFLMDFARKDAPPIGKQTDWVTGIIDLPKEPNTFFFNPSIIRDRNGKIILFARRCRNKRESGDSAIFEKNDIMVFELNRDMSCKSKLLLNLPVNDARENFEDPRIVRFGDNWGLSCCSFIPNKSYAHQTVFLLDNSMRCLQRIDPVYGNNMAQPGTNIGNEKNWLWFAHGGSPYMIYRANPHRVVRMDGRLSPVEEHSTDEFNPLWQHGEVRGGTNPVLVEDLFWTFFHSSLPWIGGKRRYYMGAYAFENRPPFRIVRMTTLPLLTGTNQEHWFPGLPAVVFPCGAFHDRQSDSFTISFGVNDIACGHITIPMCDLMELTKKIREKRDVVSDEKPAKPILEQPSFRKVKTQRTRKSRYDKLAERIAAGETAVSERGA
jgi:predicted GH43/DUF377 family glycosyl hydrolase